MKLRKRLLNLFVACIDCPLLALLTLGNCVRGETISGAVYRQEQKGNLQGRIFRPVQDFLLRPLEPDHCAISYLNERYLHKATP